MPRFFCSCGQRVFFENTVCQTCNANLAYEPNSGQLLSSLGRSHWLDADGNRFSLCENAVEYHVCNWLIPQNTGHRYCRACRLNHMIPSLLDEKNRDNWAHMELAKRQLLIGLQQQGLAFDTPDQRIRFAFIEDKRSNPLVEEVFVPTGYQNGLITVNLLEADVLQREQQRIALGESYRSLLGHFRHEIGHFYFETLILPYADHLQGFRQLFGDETQDYQAALNAFYQQTNKHISDVFISHYAQAHPLEDWAECWMHYLHICDVLTTAIDHQLIPADTDTLSFDQKILKGMPLFVGINALNRSVGMPDPYPFVITPTVIEKLAFVDFIVRQTDTRDR